MDRVASKYARVSWKGGASATEAVRAIRGCLGTDLGLRISYDIFKRGYMTMDHPSDALALGVQLEAIGFRVEVDLQ